MAATGLDDGSVSRIVRRLDEELLLERRERELQPRDPGRLLNASVQDYRFTHHDILTGHISGSGVELARDLAQRLGALDVRHAFTGLPAAWAIDHFARFRLTTVYVEGDPRDAAKRLELRQGSTGANVQLIGPDDLGVFIGERPHDGLNCVSPAQVYLDLLNLPERAHEAAEHLRHHHAPPDKPRHHSGYQREETALVEAACLTVAVTLGALTEGRLRHRLHAAPLATASPTSPAASPATRLSTARWSIIRSSHLPATSSSRTASAPGAQRNSRAPGTSTPRRQLTPTETWTTSCAPAASAGCPPGSAGFSIGSPSRRSGAWGGMSRMPTIAIVLPAVAHDQESSTTRK